jgi:hypothetical protein
MCAAQDSESCFTGRAAQLEHARDRVPRAVPRNPLSPHADAQGAFATVERAWYMPEPGSARREVAVKRLKPEIFQSPEDFECARPGSLGTAGLPARPERGSRGLYACMADVSGDQGRLLARCPACLHGA